MRLGIKLRADELTTLKEHNDEHISVLTVHKRVGNVLDEILFEMQEQRLVVPDELMELKQWLRQKGNSDREQGNFKEMWVLE